MAMSLKQFRPDGPIFLVALSVALGTAAVLNVAQDELSSEQQEEVRSKFRE